MWSALCVTLGEILEVRGSNLTEEEAWVLLYAIGRQLKNVPDEISHNFVIVHENVQLHRNGGLSIKFVSRHQDAFPELHQLGDRIENALIYSLGMSLLICLQSGIPQGQFLNISDDLQDILSVMISPNCAHSKFEEITNHGKFQSGNWEFHVTECFKELYKSIFGSMSDMQLLQDFRDIPFQDNTPKREMVEKAVQVTDNDRIPSIAINGKKEYTQNLVHQDILRSHNEIERAEPEECRLLTSPPWSAQGSIGNEEGTQTTRRQLTESVHKKRSMLFCPEPPLQLNLCQMSSDFKNASHVTVEYLNQNRLRINLDIRKLTCGHVLGVSLYHLVAPLDATSFCLNIMKDGEYLLLKPNATVEDVANTYFKDKEPQFYLRLKFIPDDLNSVLDNHLMKAMYMQTRKDILDGFISCKTEEALLLAAYSLQYEWGDLEHSPTAYRLRDYIPPHIISRHGTNYLRVSLQCLHARLKETTKGSGRILYMRKAIELSDYGSHTIFIYLTKKHQHSASGRLLISPRGVKIIRAQGDDRALLHQFSWDTLEKVSFKNSSISIVAKSGVKIKFYVQHETRSKYVVLMLGEAHRYHRFHDFQNAEQFSHPVPPSMESLKLAVKDTKLTLKANSDSKSDTVTKSAESSSRISEKTKAMSSLCENELSHPEISPYVPGVSQLSSDRTTVEASGTSSDRVAMAMVHVDNDQTGEFYKRELPPQVHDELTDVSSESSEDDVDDDGLPTLQTLKEPNFNEVATASAKSRMEEDVYARPRKPKVANLVPATQPNLHVTYARPIKEKAGGPISRDKGNTKPKPTSRQADILHRTSTGGARLIPSNIETGSRGEGDGISNFSGPDQPDHHIRVVSRDESGGRDIIPEDVTNTINDFEKFKRRIILQKGRKNLGGM